MKLHLALIFSVFLFTGCSNESAQSEAPVSTQANSASESAVQQQSGVAVMPAASAVQAVLAEPPKRESVFSFSDGRVEWYTSPMAEMMGNKTRSLWIKGDLRNNGSDTLTNINCVARMDVNFANGRNRIFESQNLCADTPDPSLGSWAIKAKQSAQIENREAGGRSLWQGPAVGEEFMDYDVDYVQLTINVSASTPFGDKTAEEVYSGRIPAPNHRAAVTLARN